MPHVSNVFEKLDYHPYIEAKRCIGFYLKGAELSRVLGLLCIGPGYIVANVYSAPRHGKALF